MIPHVPAKTILVVDDCAGVCEVIHVLLCRSGYHVITATNGSEALRLARQEPDIDLLLCNLNMPGMGGEEVAARFAQSHPWTPVVFTASFCAPGAIAETDIFLGKPFTAAQVRDTVRRALHSRPVRVEQATAA